MSGSDDNLGGPPSEFDTYVLSERDRSIITATKLLLRKIARFPAIIPRQMEAVANVLGVFERLPQVPEGVNAAVSLAGPRRCYGEL
jgi:hypothetical protein